MNTGLNQLAENITQLAHLARPQQLNHIEQQIENFSGAMIEHVPPHARAPIMIHINTTAQHYENAVAAQAHTGTAFQYQIHHALLNLNTASEMIAAHQHQHLVAAAVVPHVPPIAEEEVVGDEIHSNPSDPSDSTQQVAFSTPSTQGSDHTQNILNGDIDSDNTGDTEDILNAPGGAPNHVGIPVAWPPVEDEDPDVEGIEHQVDHNVQPVDVNIHDEPAHEAEEIDQGDMLPPANNNIDHGQPIEDDLVVEDLE